MSHAVIGAKLVPSASNVLYQSASRHSEGGFLPIHPTAHLGSDIINVASRPVLPMLWHRAFVPSKNQAGHCRRIQAARPFQSACNHARAQPLCCKPQARSCAVSCIGCQDACISHLYRLKGFRSFTRCIWPFSQAVL